MKGAKRWTLAASVGLIFAAGALLTTTRPEAAAAPAESKPDPLAIVPGDGMMFFSVRVADLLSHEAVKLSREKVLKEWPDVFKDSAKQFGVGPEEMDRFVLVQFNATPQGGPLIGVTTLKPYDKKKVLEAIGSDGKDQKVKEQSIYQYQPGMAVTFPDDRTLLFGHPEALKAYFERPAEKKDGALTPVLKTAGEKHAFVMGVDMEAFVKASGAAGRDMPPEMKPLKPLLKTKSAVLTCDLGDRASGSLKLTFANETDANDAEKGLVQGQQMLAKLLTEFRKTLEKQDDAKQTAAILTEVQASLNGAKPTRDGSEVVVAASIKVEPRLASDVIAREMVRLHKEAIRSQSANNLKQLTLAMINYADTNKGVLPAQASYDKNGKALLSWRVMILPYIEQDQLYKQFHLDEPWDSDHNKKLLEKMPATFAMPDSQAEKNHETFYQGFVGKDAFFDGKNGLRFPADFPDGTSNTIMFVEAAKSVPWTKPEDVPFDAGKLGPRVGGIFKDGFHVAMCDGSVRYIRLPIKAEDVFHLMVTRSDGMPIDIDKLDK
jgi:hypothetical protein